MPLNPELYNRLKRNFGHVKISNEGEAFSGRYAYDFVNDRKSLSVDYPGEYYQVCCPRCTDTRFRLYINHRWGTRDETGRLNLWLMVCYNEDCWSNYERCRKFYDELSSSGSALAIANIREGVEVREAAVVASPGDIVPLASLPAHHPANRYLGGQFFQPELLSAFYGVGFCRDSDYYLAKNRIYIPLMYDGQLRGWQCRYVGELNWKESKTIKYFSCPNMHRGKMLYNYHRAVTYKTGVVMEGPKDVWSFGPMGMGTLGFPITSHQCKILTAGFQRHSAVLLFDPDIDNQPRLKEAYDRIYKEISGNFRYGLAMVKPPADRDPGELDRGYLREYVRKEAAAQDVKVSWEMR